MVKKKTRQHLVITYNGVDGACSAAVFLLKYPFAEVIVTSSNKISSLFAQIGKKGRTPEEIHVCGVGVSGDWDKLRQQTASLRKNGCEIFWHCGRGYLKEDEKLFSTFCQPVFVEARNNTAAIASYFELESEAMAKYLVHLADFDERISGDDYTKSNEGEQNWLDFINAARSQYFKYQDSDSYPRAIKTLASGERAEDDERLIEVFKRTELQYVLLGRSENLRTLRQRIRKCAEVDRPVIITGESGVGKDFVAHLLHERSGERATGPFVPVNCAVFAGSSELANSILFGHKKGAFTGALNNRQGAFVLAGGGILFLDEIGELPMEIQGKLLRVLEDKMIIPVGADEPEPKGGVDVRIIAASNSDLPEMIRKGTFRADLYHRLSTLRIHISPLREHLEDIPAILGKTLARLQYEGYEVNITTEDIKALADYRWPGNVRQLIKVIERAIFLEMPIEQVLQEERELGELCLVGDDKRSKERFLPQSPDDIKLMKQVQHEYVLSALQVMDNNKSATAKKLGLQTNTLRAYLKKIQ